MLNLETVALLAQAAREGTKMYGFPVHVTFYVPGDNPLLSMAEAEGIEVTHPTWGATFAAADGRDLALPDGNPHGEGDSMNDAIQALIEDMDIMHALRALKRAEAKVAAATGN